MSAAGRYPIRIVRNPVGIWEGWITKDEIEFVVRNYLGSVEIQRGFWFIPDKYVMPFDSLIKDLIKFRRSAEGSSDMLVNNLGKVTAAALQGRFIQSFMHSGKRVVGNSFNPVYASVITSRVRLRVAEIALDNQEDILMVMVDGILSSKPLVVPKQWKLAHQGSCVIAKHGDYDIPGRRTAVSLKGMLEDYRKDTGYPLTGPRYVSISEAIEGDWFDIACRRRPETKAYVNKVGKRSWDKLPRYCNDLLTKQYESVPLMAQQSILHQ
jgi:hypothetical protein